MTSDTFRRGGCCAVLVSLAVTACSVGSPPEGGVAARVEPVAAARDRGDSATQPAPERLRQTLPDAPRAEPATAAPAAPAEHRALAGKLAHDQFATRESLATPAASYAPAQAPHGQVQDRERYAAIKDNGVVSAAVQPFSTFSIDVDTGSYANMRRFLNAGRLPPTDAVRVEEMINYFPYAYREPQREADGRRPPFGVTTELAAAPWNPDALLLRIGIKAFDAPRAGLPPANLVFLVDVSGSMNEPNKLPLLKNALRLLVEHLRPDDRVALVTYASGTRVVLPPTSGADKLAIRLAIDQLTPGGSTAGAAGIELAYRMAQQAYRADGINRILLATDGDFNVGITDFAQLKGMIEEKRRSGVSLSTLGFGDGNYREDLMEQLADAGDGNYSYIDTLNEAQKVLVDQASSTLSVVARDVKIQMEFNPAVVAEYRLIGYENRALQREDFRNDKVDAGEIGAGHTVTALYELSLVGKPGRLGATRYTADAAVRGTLHADEIGMLRLRYKGPQGGETSEIAAPILRAAMTPASEDLRFAASVAAFGQQLRGGKYLGRFGYGEIEQLAAAARGSDPFGYRGEFVRLVRLAATLATATPACGPSGDCLRRQ